MNAGKQNGQKSKGTREAAPEWDDVFNSPLVSTDLPNGQYPARLIGKTPIFMVPSRFETSGRAPRFNFLFAVKNPTTGSVIVLQSQLLSPPSRQASGAGIHSKSNLYKILKPLANDDPSLWDVRADNVAGKATINAFIGRPANVIVEKDDGGFSRVRDVVIAPAGTVFPTEDEALEAMATFEAHQEERARERSAGGGSSPPDRDDGPPLDEDELQRDTRA